MIKTNTSESKSNREYVSEVIYIEVIETNLIIDENNIIRDHQSRVVEADSWDKYCEAHKNHDGKAIFFKSKVMIGNSIQSNCRISNLKYDEMHLSCNITKLKDNEEEIFTDKRLAYRIVNPT